MQQKSGFAAGLSQVTSKHCQFSQKSKHYFHCSKLLLNTHTDTLSHTRIYRVTSLLSLHCSKLSLKFLSMICKQNLLLLLGPLGKLLEHAGKLEAIDLVLIYSITRKLYTDITSPRLCRTPALARTSQPANVPKDKAP